MDSHTFELRVASVADPRGMQEMQGETAKLTGETAKLTQELADLEAGEKQLNTTFGGATKQRMDALREELALRKQITAATKENHEVQQKAAAEPTLTHEDTSFRSAVKDVRQNRRAEGAIEGFMHQGPEQFLTMGVVRVIESITEAAGPAIAAIAGIGLAFETGKKVMETWMSDVPHLKEEMENLAAAVEGTLGNALKGIFGEGSGVLEGVKSATKWLGFETEEMKRLHAPISDLIPVSKNLADTQAKLAREMHAVSVEAELQKTLLEGLDEVHKASSKVVTESIESDYQDALRNIGVGDGGGGGAAHGSMDIGKGAAHDGGGGAASSRGGSAGGMVQNGGGHQAAPGQGHLDSAQSDSGRVIGGITTTGQRQNGAAEAAREINDDAKKAALQQKIVTMRASAQAERDWLLEKAKIEVSLKEAESTELGAALARQDERVAALNAMSLARAAKDKAEEAFKDAEKKLEGRDGGQQFIVTGPGGVSQVPDLQFSADKAAREKAKAVFDKATAEWKASANNVPGGTKELDAKKEEATRDELRKKFEEGEEKIAKDKVAFKAKEEAKKIEDEAAKEKSKKEDELNFPEPKKDLNPTDGKAGIQEAQDRLKAIKKEHGIDSQEAKDAYADVQRMQRDADHQEKSLNTKPREDEQRYAEAARAKSREAVEADEARKKRIVDAEAVRVAKIKAEEQYHKDAILDPTHAVNPDTPKDAAPGDKSAAPEGPTLKQIEVNTRSLKPGTSEHSESNDKAGKAVADAQAEHPAHGLAAHSNSAVTGRGQSPHETGRSMGEAAAEPIAVAVHKAITEGDKLKMAEVAQQDHDAAVAGHPRVIGMQSDDPNDNTGKGKFAAGGRGGVGGYGMGSPHGDTPAPAPGDPEPFSHQPQEHRQMPPGTQITGTPDTSGFAAIHDMVAHMGSMVAHVGELVGHSRQAAKAFETSTHKDQFVSRIDDPFAQ